MVLGPGWGGGGWGVGVAGEEIYSTFTSSQLHPGPRSTLNTEIHKNSVRMKFNESKCKVMHLGKIPKHDYKVGNTTLDNVSQECDLGIYITEDLKPSLQCVEAAKKAGESSLCSWNNKKGHSQILIHLVLPFCTKK